MMDTAVGAKTAKTLSYTVDVPNCADYTGSVSVYDQPWLRASLTH
jgi:hypothetical protein